MFGLGWMEIALILFLGGGLLAVVLVLGLMLRRGGRAAVLKAENRRLREELDRRGRS